MEPEAKGQIGSGSRYVQGKRGLRFRPGSPLIHPTMENAQRRILPTEQSTLGNKCYLQGDPGLKPLFLIRPRGL